MKGLLGSAVVVLQGEYRGGGGNRAFFRPR